MTTGTEPSREPAGGVAYFTVERNRKGSWSVMERGFEAAIAEFSEADTAEQYALRLAESKLSWQVDVFDAMGTLTGTYNSDDDAMPKPALT